MYYSASLFFESIHEDGSEGVWEERIVIISASSQEEALSKAARIGGGEPVHYETSDGGVVTWKLVRVERVFEIDSECIDEGVEVFSRFLKKSEAESLMSSFE